MIRINIVKSNNNLKKITFKGHANYADYGKDIVCAAVSSTMLCTINAILSINKNSIEVLEQDNIYTINVIDNNDITIKLLNNMIRCLESLEKQYPKNIEIK